MSAGATGKVYLILAQLTLLIVSLVGALEAVINIYSARRALKKQ